ncbi:hypothetical protein TNCV_4055271 [Trichonephila clavipes]|nr:hypothetical protein TNCV_4055271 [Trichonephila clavipes]
MVNILAKHGYHIPTPTLFSGVMLPEKSQNIVKRTVSQTHQRYSNSLRGPFFGDFPSPRKASIRIKTHFRGGTRPSRGIS